MTYLTIIDDAVKIGFGTLIGGIFAYVLAKYNNNATNKRNLAQQNIDLLVMAGEQLGCYLHSLEDHMNIEGINNRNRQDNLVTSAWKYRHSALCKLKLVSGKKNVLTLVNKAITDIENLKNIETRYRVLYRVDVTVDLDEISQTDIDHVWGCLNSKRDEIYKCLSEAIKLLY